MGIIQTPWRGNEGCAVAQGLPLRCVGTDLVAETSEPKSTTNAPGVSYPPDVRPSEMKSDPYSRGVADLQRSIDSSVDVRAPQHGNPTYPETSCSGQLIN